MLEHALKYIEKGWLLIPCEDNGKKPIISNWTKGGASNDPEQIKKWWIKNPNANISALAGPGSGIFVVDLDRKKSVDGFETLKKLEETYSPLPPTLESFTPNGGKHLYFKYPEGADIRVQIGVRPGIDILATGSKIMLPSSKIDGRFYSWLNEQEIAEAPEWVCSLLKEKKTTKIKDSKDLIESERNTSLTAFAGQMKKVGIGKDELMEALTSLNNHRCSPPLDMEEIVAISKSVSRYDNSDAYTDIWLGEMFSQEQLGKICFCENLGGWYFWNKSKWVLDKELNVIRKMKAWLKSFLVKAKNDRDVVLYDKIKKASADGRIQSLLNLTKSEEGIGVSQEEFDQEQYYVNCNNGVIDLEKQKLLPHSPDLYLTNQVSVNYNKEASITEWLKFLDSIFLGDKDMIKYVQKSLGYSLTGSTEEQCFFVLYGNGNNGKSTFLAAVRKIFNDYAKHTPAATLMESRSGAATNDVARLVGARLVTASESDTSVNLAESKIKELTGDDTITARFLHKEFFQFRPMFKLFLLTNKLPNVRGTDKGIWRRIIPIPFNLNLEEHEKDYSLPAKLENEFEGIFAWIVEGFRLWREEGLERTDTIKQSLDTYRDDTDIIGNFISERYELSSDFIIPSSELIKDIHSWVKEESNERMVRYDIIDSLKKKGFIKERKDNGPYFFRGLRKKSGGGDVNVSI